MSIQKASPNPSATSSKNKKHSKFGCKNECLVCENYVRKIKEIQQTTAGREMIIEMLQTQIKKTEHKYKGLLEEYEQLRYRYCTTDYGFASVENLHDQLELIGGLCRCKTSPAPQLKPEIESSTSKERLQDELERYKKECESLRSQLNDENRFRHDSILEKDDFREEVTKIENLINNQNAALKKLLMSVLEEMERLKVDPSNIKDSIQELTEINEELKSSSFIFTDKDTLLIKDNKIKELQDEIKTLQKNLQTYKSQNEDLNKTIADNKYLLCLPKCNNSSNFLDISSSINDVIEDYNQKIKELQDMLKEKAKEIQELKKNKNRCEQTLKAKDLQIQELTYKLQGEYNTELSEKCQQTDKSQNEILNQSTATHKYPLSTETLCDDNSNVSDILSSIIEDVLKIKEHCASCSNEKIKDLRERPKQKGKTIKEIQELQNMRSQESILKKLNELQSTIKEHEQELIDKDAHIKELTNELKKKVQNEQKQLAEGLEHTKELQKEINNLEQTIKELKNNKDQLTQQIGQVEQSNNILSESLVIMSKENEGFLAKTEQLCDQLKRATEEAEGLQKEKDNLEKIVNELRNTKDQLTQQIEQVEQSNNTLSETLVIVTEENKGNLAKTEQLYDELKKATQEAEECADLKTSLKRAGDEVEELTKKLAKLEDEIVFSRTSHIQAEEKIASLNESNKKLKKEITGLNKQIREKDRKINQLEHEFLFFRSSKFDVTRNSRMSQINDNPQYLQLQKEVGESKTVIENLNKLLEEKDSQIEKLERFRSSVFDEDLKSNVQLDERYSQLINEIKDLNKQIEDRDNRIEKLEKEFNFFRYSLYEANKSDTDKKSSQLLLEQVKKTESVINDLNKQIQESDKKLSNLEEQLQYFRSSDVNPTPETNKNQSELLQEISNFTRSTNDLRKQIEDRDRVIEKLKQDFSSEEVRKSKNLINDLNSQLQAKDSKIQEQEKEISIYRESLSRANSQTKELETNVNELGIKVQEQEQDISFYRASLSRADSQIKELEANVNELAEENSKINVKAVPLLRMSKVVINDLSKQLQERDEKIENLEKEVETYSTKSRNSVRFSIVEIKKIDDESEDRSSVSFVEPEEPKSFMNHLTQQLEEKNKKLEEQEEEIAFYRKSLIQADNQVESLKKSIKDLTEGNQNLQSFHKTKEEPPQFLEEVGKSKSVINDLSRQLEEKDTKLEELTEEIAFYRSSLIRADNEAEALKAEVKDLTEKNQKLQLLSDSTIYANTSSSQGESRTGVHGLNTQSEEGEKKSDDFEKGMSLNGASSAEKKNQSEELNRIIKDLTEENKKLQFLNDDLKRQVETKNKEIEESKHAVSDLNRETDQVTKRAKGLEEEISIYRTSSIQTENQIKELNKIIKDLTEENKNLQFSNDDLRREVEKQKRSIDDFKPVEKEDKRIEDLEEEIGFYRSSLIQSNNEIEELQAKVKDLTEKNEKLQSQYDAKLYAKPSSLQETENQVEELNKSIEDLTKENKKLQLINDDLRREIEKRSRSVNDFKSEDKDKRTEELEEEVAFYRASLNRAHNEAEELKTTVKDLTEKIEKIQVQASDVTEQDYKRTKGLDEENSFHEASSIQTQMQVKELNAANRNLSEENKKLQLLNNDLKGEVEKYKVSLDDLKSVEKKNRTEELEEEIAFYRASLVRANNESEELKTKVKDLTESIKKLRSQTGEEDNRAQVLEKDNPFYGSYSIQTENLIEELNATIKYLTEENKKLQLLNNDLRRDIETYKRSLDELKSVKKNDKTEELKEEIALYRESLNQANNEAEKLKTKVRELTEKVEKLQSLDDSRTNAKTSTLKRELEKIKNSVSDVNRQTDEKDQRAKTLEEENKKLKLSNKDLRREVERKEKGTEEMEEEIAFYRASLFLADNENEKLKTKVNDLTSKIEKLQALDNSTASAKTSTIKGELETSQNVLSDLNRQREQEQKRVEEEKMSFIQTENQVEELNTANKYLTEENKKLQLLNNDLRREVEKYKRSLDDSKLVEKKDKQAKELEDEIAFYRESLIRAESQAEKLNTKVKELTEKIEKLQSRDDSKASAKTSTIKGKLETSKNVLSDLNRQTEQEQKRAKEEKKLSIQTENQVEELNTANKYLTKENKKLQELNNDLRREVEKYKHSLDDSKSVEKKDKQAKELEDEIAFYRESLIRAESQSEKLNTKVNELTEKIEKLQSRDDSKAHAKTATINGEIEKSRSALNDVNRQTEEDDQKAKGLGASPTQTDNQVEELKTTIKYLTEENKKLQFLYNDVTGEVEQYKRSLDDLKSVEKKDKKIEELEEEITSCQASLVRADNEVEELKRKVKDLTEKNQYLQSLDDDKIYAKTLSVPGEMEKSRSVVHDVNIQIEGDDKIAERLEKEMSITQTENKVEELKKTIKDLTEENNKLQASLYSNKELKREAEIYKSVSDDLSKQIQDSTEKNRKLISLTDDLKREVEEYKRLLHNFKQTEESDRKTEELEEDIGFYRSSSVQAEELNISINNLTEENKNLQTLNNDLRREVEEYKRLLGDLEHIGDRDRRIQELEEEIGFNRSATTQSENQVREHKTSIKSIPEENKELQHLRQVETYKSVLDDLNKKMQDLTEENKNLKTICDSKDESKREVEKYKSVLDDLNNQVQDRDRMITRQHEQIKFHQTRNESLQQELEDMQNLLSTLTVDKKDTIHTKDESAGSLLTSESKKSSNTGILSNKSFKDTSSLLSRKSAISGKLKSSIAGKENPADKFSEKRVRLSAKSEDGELLGSLKHTNLPFSQTKNLQLSNEILSEKHMAAFPGTKSSKSQTESSPNTSLPHTAATKYSSGQTESDQYVESKSKNAPYSSENSLDNRRSKQTSDTWSRQSSMEMIYKVATQNRRPSKKSYADVASQIRINRDFARPSLYDYKSRPSIYDSEWRKSETGEQRVSRLMPCLSIDGLPEESDTETETINRVTANETQKRRIPDASIQTRETIKNKLRTVVDAWTQTRTTELISSKPFSETIGPVRIVSDEEEEPEYLKTINDMKRKITTLENEIEKSRKEKQDSEDQIGINENKYQGTITELGDEIEKLRKGKQDCEDQIAINENKYQGTITELEDEIEKLQKEKQACRDQIELNENKYQGTITAIEDEIEKLQKEKQACHDQIELTESKYQGIIKELEAEIVKLQKEKQDCQDQIGLNENKYQSIIKDLEDEIEKLQKEKQACHDQIELNENKYQGIITELEAEIEKLQKEKQDYQEQILLNENKYQSTIKEIEDEIEKLQKEKQAYEDQIELNQNKYQDKLDNMRQEILKSQENIDALLKDHELKNLQFKVVCQELEKLKTTIGEESIKYQQHVKRLEEEISELEMDNKNLQNDKNRKQAIIEELEKTIEQVTGEFSNRQTIIEELEDTILKLRPDDNRMQRCEEELKVQKAKNIKQQDIIGELQIAVEKLSADRKKTDAIIEELENTNEQLMQEIRTKQENIDELEHTVETSKSILEQWSEKVEKLVEENERLKDHEIELKSKVRRSTMDAEHLKRNVSHSVDEARRSLSQTGDNERLRQEIEQLNEDIEFISIKCKEHCALEAEKNEIVVKELEGLKEEYIALQDEYADILADNRKLKREIENLMGSDIDASSKELRMSLQRNESIKNENDRLKDQYAKLLKDYELQTQELDKCKKDYEGAHNVSKVNRDEYNNLKREYKEIKRMLSEQIQKYKTDTLSDDKGKRTGICSQLKHKLLEKEREIQNLHTKLHTASIEIIELKDQIHKLISDYRILKTSINNLISDLERRIRSSGIGDRIKHVSVESIAGDILLSLTSIESKILRKSSSCPIKECDCISEIISGATIENSKLVMDQVIQPSTSKEVVPCDCGEKDMTKKKSNGSSTDSDEFDTSPEQLQKFKDILTQMQNSPKNETCGPSECSHYPKVKMCESVKCPHHPKPERCVQLCGPGGCPQKPNVELSGAITCPRPQKVAFCGPGGGCSCQGKADSCAPVVCTNKVEFLGQVPCPHKHKSPRKDK